MCQHSRAEYYPDQYKKYVDGFSRKFGMMRGRMMQYISACCDFFTVLINHNPPHVLGFLDINYINIFNYLSPKQKGISILNSITWVNDNR